MIVIGQESGPLKHIIYNTSLVLTAAYLMVTCAVNEYKVPLPCFVSALEYTEVILDH